MKKIFYLIALGALLFGSCTKPEPIGEPTYSFEIGAEKEGGGTDETRVEMVDGLMHWSVGDKIGMYITDQVRNNPQYLYVNNFAMTGTHTSPTRATTFKGLLTQSQISQLDPTKTYRHFSYYPYGSMVVYNVDDGSAGTIMKHTIPMSFTVRPNEFPMDMVYMFATEGDIAPPMTWLENGEQKWSETRTFTYKHTMAYLRVKINQNSSGRRINRIRVTNYIYGSSVSVVGLSGRIMLYSNYKEGNNYFITYNNGATNGSHYQYVEANIDGGMDVGDYIYIPMPANRISPYMSWSGGRERTLLFSFFDTSYNFATKKLPVTSTPIYLEAGKIYDIAFNL